MSVFTLLFTSSEASAISTALWKTTLKAWEGTRGRMNLEELENQEVGCDHCINPITDFTINSIFLI